uniref:RING-type E3 ubiquitin transferase n=1 Tax=Panagrolaimus sp. JU765 TaxID=591449 RepID=A0AC34QC05_9BILA
MPGVIPVACRFYIVGKCNKSSECKFLHDKSAPVNLFCTKNLVNRCHYENRCKYIHDKDIPKVEINWRPKLCRSFYEHGICRKRFNCSDIHGQLCNDCALFAILPDDINGEKHQETCKLEMENMCRRYSAESLSKKCSICHISVVKQRHRFAIMECCCHVFCTPCIRKWRSINDQPRQSTKGCPLCRIVSPIFIPSDYWIDDLVEKQIFFDNYKRKVSKQPCRYLLNGQKLCPFGSKCFYSHEVNEIEICRGKPGLHHTKVKK